VTNHYDEEAQAEQLRQWWKENWQSLAAGLLIGLAAIFGWETWKSHQQKQAAAASQMYEDLKKAIAGDKIEDANSIGDKLTQEFPKSPYAADAELRLAARAVNDKRFDDASTRLGWVIEHGNDDGLKPLVRLRQARVLWQQGKNDDALKVLDGDAGTYGPLFDELRGDIHLAQGDRAGAAAAYRKALDAGTESASADEPPVDKSALQRKLDDLADVVKS
jgi:predicted negative regulator of RcsB-dependent stress response